jgi:hypothetical protein
MSMAIGFSPLVAIESPHSWPSFLTALAYVCGAVPSPVRFCDVRVTPAGDDARGISRDPWRSA